MKLNVMITKIDEKAIIPAYAHDGDAGVDLFSIENVVLKAGERKLVHTGIKMAIPYGYEGQVRPKSGLALKSGISVVNTPGTVDAPYRGEVCVILINTDKCNDYEIHAGDKIAQMVFNKVETATFTQVDNLPDTDRGTGGFGSTGK